MKFKWVQQSPGHFKLVDISDPRPAVKLDGRKGYGAPRFHFTPSWKKHEVLMWNTDKKTSMEATDKFIDERDHATKTDSQARRWEEGRKKEWMRNKPYWIKKYG